MHILIIPSERYLPADNPLDGIFQRDQALILKNNGIQVGIISVSLKYSYFMLIKAFLCKIIRLKINNELKNYDPFAILEVLISKMFFPFKFISKELIDEIPVVRIESSYLWFLSPKNECKGWLKGGLIAFKEYLDLYGKPDIIHSHNMVFAGIFAVELKKIYKIPVLVTEHSSYYARNLYNPYTLEKVSNSFNEIDKIITVSDSLGAQLKQKFNTLTHYQVIPNVLDNYFINTEFDFKKSKDTFTFINIGSFLPVKGQVNLIKAFSLKFGHDKRFVLKIIGGGELKAELIKLACTVGVNDQVQIFDRLTRKQIIKEMDNSNIYVFSSVYETFGVALIEALSRGLPVVSTKCGGPEGLIEESNGLLVENENIEALANGLELLYKNFEKYDQVLIRKNCITNYGPEGFLRKIRIIYTLLINHE